MKLDLLVKLKHESSTIILFVGIKYSMRDLLSDLTNYAWLANWRYVSDTLNDVSASSGISSPWQAVNSMCKWSFRWRFIYKKVLLFPYFLFSSGFQTRLYQMHWFYPYCSFKHSPASDDVTN